MNWKYIIMLNNPCISTLILQLNPRPNCHPIPKRYGLKKCEHSLIRHFISFTPCWWCLSLITQAKFNISIMLLHTNSYLIIYDPGLVRSIDTLKGILYIITPVPHNSLEKVDLLLQGYIQIPSCLLQV